MTWPRTPGGSELPQAARPIRRSRRVLPYRNLLVAHALGRLESAPPAASWVARRVCLGVTRALLVARRRSAAFTLLARMHRHGTLDSASRLAEGLARRAVERAVRDGDATGLLAQRASRTPRGLEWLALDPGAVLGRLALVVKPRAGGERGVLIVKYDAAISHLARRFDLRQIAAGYHLVLEPSWTGYCKREILGYSAVGEPVFVQAPEPRDAGFLRRLGANLVPVPVGSNWWVDDRVFRPLPGVEKDADVVMIASWAHYKRHLEFFRVIADLRRRGHRLGVLLAGYPADLSLRDIVELAAHAGVADQLELHELVDQEEVNRLLNRARVSLVWSRREGINRAVVESMFAGVPFVLREGFNYGYPYPHVNDGTGRFASPQALPATLLEMIATHDRYAPREWASANMTCQQATMLLETAIGAAGLAVKTNSLEAMHYWDPAEAARFEADYEFLRTTISA